MSKGRFLLSCLVAAGCGGPSIAPEPPEELADNEIWVTGRISSASRLLALPISLGVPSPDDPFGLDNVLVSTVSGEQDGRYDLRTLVDPPLCDGDFTIILFDAFDRFAGKRIRGCGLHTENFNVGPGFPG